MLPYALYWAAATLEGGMVDGYTRRNVTIEPLSADDLRGYIDARGALTREHASLAKLVFGAGHRDVGCRRRTALTCAYTQEAYLCRVEHDAHDSGWFDMLRSYGGNIEISRSGRRETMTATAQLCVGRARA